MRVSVVICTWNRCELLRRTLESLSSLVVPAGQEWEALVVNNGSADATDQVIGAYQGPLPLRRVYEPQLGLSRARNQGARAATGDLVLFTDDDVRFDPGWMKAYVEAARRWPDAGYLAGETRPEFADDVPRWVRRNQNTLFGMLCSYDAGPVGRRFRPGEHPFGPNMAVRRQALSRASFDERVGRKGDGHLRGSETSLFKALQRQGVAGVWVPEAKILHYVPRSRANAKYFWRYYRGNGRAQVRLAAVSGLPLQSRRRLLGEGLRRLARAGLRSSNWSEPLATIACTSGQMSELRRLAFHPDGHQPSPVGPGSGGEGR